MKKMNGKKIAALMTALVLALASTPDEEIALLGAVDLRSQAVVTTPVALPATPDSSSTPSVIPSSPSVIPSSPSAIPSSSTVIPSSSTVIPSEASVSPAADVITLTSYAPNELHYRYTASTDRLAVFSEIYYPNGWHATVDGEPLELIRADWTLRAALLPAGSHEVVMTFLPDSYRIGATVSRVASLALLLLLVAALVLPLTLRKDEQ